MILKATTLKGIEVFAAYFLIAYYIPPRVAGNLYTLWALCGYLTVFGLVLTVWRNLLYVATRDWVILLLAGLTAFSSFWSTNPDITLAYSRALIASTLFGIYLSTRYSFRDQVKIIFGILSVILVLNFLVPIISPSYGIADVGTAKATWRGIQRHKNELSGSMTMITSLFLTFCVYSKANRLKLSILSFIGFLLILLSQGKGSLAIFLSSLVLLPLYKIVTQKYKEKVILSIIFLFIFISTILTTTLNLEYIIVDFLGKDMELNSRGPLWEHLISRGIEHPFGYGYGGFWTSNNEAMLVAQKFPWMGGIGTGGGNAHNGYIEIFLQLGWPGLILVGFHLVTTLVRVVFLFARTRRIECLCMIQIIFVIAATSFYESYGTFLAYRHWFWVLYVSVSYSSILMIQELNSSAGLPQRSSILLKEKVKHRGADNPFLH